MSPALLVSHIFTIRTYRQLFRRLKRTLFRWPKRQGSYWARLNNDTLLLACYHKKNLTTYTLPLRNYLVADTAILQSRFLATRLRRLALTGQLPFPLPRTLVLEINDAPILHFSHSDPQLPWLNPDKQQHYLHNIFQSQVPLSLSRCYLRYQYQDPLHHLWVLSPHTLREQIAFFAALKISLAGFFYPSDNTTSEDEMVVCRHYRYVSRAPKMSAQLADNAEVIDTIAKSTAHPQKIFQAPISAQLPLLKKKIVWVVSGFCIFCVIWFWLGFRAFSDSMLEREVAKLQTQIISLQKNHLIQQQQQQQQQQQSQQLQRAQAEQQQFFNRILSLWQHPDFAIESLRWQNATVYIKIRSNDLQATESRIQTLSTLLGVDYNRVHIDKRPVVSQIRGVQENNWWIMLEIPLPLTNSLP